MTRVVHFDPSKPPDAILELDAELGQLSAHASEMSRRLGVPPFDVDDWSEGAADWFFTAMRIVGAIREVSYLPVGKPVPETEAARLRREALAEEPTGLFDDVPEAFERPGGGR